MDINDTLISDLGLEYKKNPIVAVRIFRTDGQWLVEFKKKPLVFWKFWDYFWWYNDGKYVSYNDAKARAAKLSSQGFYLTTKYVQDEYVVTPFED